MLGEVVDQPMTAGNHKFFEMGLREAVHDSGFRSGLQFLTLPCLLEGEYHEQQ